MTARPTIQPDPNWTVYSSMINGLMQAAEHLGADVDGLLKSVGIERAVLRDSERRVPVSCLLQFYELAARQTGVVDIGLYTGRISHLNGLNLQLHMSTLCDTFRDYLNLIPSVLRFAGDIGEVVIRGEGDLIRLEWMPLWPATAKARFLSDEMLTISAAIVNSLCVRPIPVIRAHFTYPKPDDLSMLITTFGDDLSFGQPVSCLYFERASLDYPLMQLDMEVGQAMTQTVQHLFADEMTEDAFLTQLRETLLRLLPAGKMSIDQVASELNVSRRTLQRRLSDRDTQFLQVLQSVRSNLALRYLADKRLAVIDIAFLLGYADQGSFSNAFKSWHGVSPRDYR